MDSRFRYVWQHFRSLYLVPAGLQVDYGPEGPAPVRIVSQASSFFSQQAPWPRNIAWKEWLGSPLPLLFAADASLPILSQKQGMVVVNYDIIAGAFYFLSGWQEYHAPDRDRHGRFPYQSSLQYKLGCIRMPVVNYYFDILKTAIEQATGTILKTRFNPEAACTVLLTHDIDNSQSGWKEALRAAWQERKAGNLLRAVCAPLRGRDPWFNWMEIADLAARSGAASTFFFLCEQRPYRGIRNADYTVTRKKYQQAIKALAGRGVEIAIHGSLEASEEVGKLKQEIRRLPVPVEGNRFHYLRFEPCHTPALLDAAGLAYDSSLGFAEHFGFRHSYCFPFRLFNFREDKPYEFLEIPLILMDATLHHPHYLQLAPEEVMPALRPVLSEIEKFKGVFTLLWHNENFTRHKKTNGLAIFKELLAALKQRKVIFTTGRSLTGDFSPWLREP